MNYTKCTNDDDDDDAQKITFWHLEKKIFLGVGVFGSIRIMIKMIKMISLFSLQIQNEKRIDNLL